MANFFKCKQESSSYKIMKNELDIVENVKQFFGSKKISHYKEVLDKECSFENVLINLDVVISVKKTIGLHDKHADYQQIKETGKFGICFNCLEESESWYYDNENDRDEQYNFLANNTQLYKSKVIL